MGCLVKLPASSSTNKSKFFYEKTLTAGMTFYFSLPESICSVICFMKFQGKLKLSIFNKSLYSFEKSFIKE